MRHEMTAGELSVDDATNVLKTEFDCRPGAIAQSLALREPKYQETAENCHFGRQPETRNDIKFFEGRVPRISEVLLHEYRPGISSLASTAL